MRHDTSDWRDDRSYDFFDTLPIEGLAWECLRRYQPYQDDYAGLVDAGVMSNLDWQDPTRMPVSYREELRPLYVSEQFPRALELVSAKMRPEVRERLKQVLLEAENDPAAAKALEAFFRTTGFEPIDAQMRRELDYIDAAVTQVRKDVE